MNDFNITSLDVSDLEALETLDIICDIDEIDLSNLTQLVGLGLTGNNLTSLDVSNNNNLQTLVIPENNISSIDVSNLEDLEVFNFDHNPLTEIDLSHNYKLEYITLHHLPNLTYANLKNGNNQNLSPAFVGAPHGLFEACPNLQSVCVDDVESFTSVLYDEAELGPPDFTVTSDCTDSPAQSNTITGQISLNQGDGCGASTATGVPNTMVKTTLGDHSYASFSANDGTYTVYTGEGQSSTTVESNLSAYVSISPNSQNSDFTGFDNSDQIDFCAETTQSTSDLNVSIIPLNDVVPGFSSSYKIVYENMGTTTASGQITLGFDEGKQVFNTAAPSETNATNNTLNFDFDGLQPFHHREITVEFTTAEPPTVNDGDQVSLTAHITPDGNDQSPEDNSYQLDQTAVNSFDPNDKRVMEGDEIDAEDTGRYLHYIIRFQNTGTANAQQVVVTDTLSDNLDWNSLKMVSASDDYQVKIKNGNAVEFRFKNIQLPFEGADEEGSHGYIAYKIKPKEDIHVGDVISGNAAIYFDFNSPVITNNATTTVVDQFSVEDHKMPEIKLYPNPTSGIVNISTGKNTTLKSLSVFSISGKKVMERKDSSTLDLSVLSQGIYFVKILDGQGHQTVKKVVKK